MEIRNKQKKGTNKETNESQIKRDGKTCKRKIEKTTETNELEN
jgi:hypothetical protein